MFSLDVLSNSPVHVHVNIGDPNQREPRNDVAPPVVKEHFESSDEQKRKGDIVAEAEFAGQHVKEFADGQFRMRYAIFCAPRSKLPK